jgi:hypothetical protein
VGGDRRAPRRRRRAGALVVDAAARVASGCAIAQLARS